MSEKANEVLEAAMRLPEEERAEVAAQLLETFAPLPEDDPEMAAEIARRIAEMDSGAVKPIPWEEVRQRLWEGL